MLTPIPVMQVEPTTGKLVGIYPSISKAARLAHVSEASIKRSASTPGGCVAGAGTIAPVAVGTANVEKFKKSAALQSCTETPYLTSLNDVEMAHLITPPGGETKSYPVTRLSEAETSA